jgi:sulfatase modifying factor 1
MRVGPGEYGLHVKRDGLEFDTDKPIVMKRGDDVTLKIEWLKDGKLQVVQGGNVIGAKELPKVAIAVAPPVVPGKYALRFDGETSVVEIPSLNVAELKEWCIEAKMTDELNASATVASEGWALCLVRVTPPFWRIQTDSMLVGAGRANVTHVAAVRKGDDLKLFLNGKLLSGKPVALVGKLPPSPEPFRLGAAFAGKGLSSFFKGTMSEVRISNVACYHKDFTPAKRFEPDADTLALYHFDEGSGDVLKDSSGNGHHGKIVGAKWVKADGTAIAPAPPPFVPLTFGEKEAKKQQEDWAAKLKAPVEATNKIGMKLRLIPPGDGVAKPFYLGKYEVTQGEWQEVMGYNPSGFGPTNPKVKGMDTSKFPVETVSWYDSVEFCNKLSEREGLKLYYELTVTKRGGKDGKQIDEAEVKILGGSGYHLPTEAEWEHGCRAGTKTAYHFGDREDDLPDYAWFDNNSEGRTHAVGEKKPNAFGLFDMHGNVWEWTENSFSVGDTRRVLRGGAFCHPASSARSAVRAVDAPANRGDGLGFRPARTADGSASAAIPPLDPAWVPLFNGKDLTGWAPEAGKPNNNWKVVDGAITCTGPESYLYSAKEDYADFHLRVEAKVNAGGNSGVFFGAANPRTNGWGYEAQIDSTVDKQKTGSLYGLVAVEQQLVPPDQWFVMEIIAKGPKIEIRDLRRSERDELARGDRRRHPAPHPGRGPARPINRRRAGTP